MKQICLHCKRTSVDQSLYCPELDCPAEQAPYIFEEGDRIEDLEILRLVAVVRTSALYKAFHQDKMVLLKVAHPGYENLARLEREVEFLSTLNKDDQHHELLPQLLPPYVGTSIEDDLYGSTIVNEYLLYFALFSWSDGDSLEYLLQGKLPLWINDAGWITMQLTDAIGAMHDSELLHLSLTPGSILIRRDRENKPRLYLWDLGCVWEHSPELNQEDNLQNPLPKVTPAYLAPELNRYSVPVLRPSFSTDIYSIGTVFFEMLVGRPMYAHAMRSDIEIGRNAGASQRYRMTRRADAEVFSMIVEKAVDPSPSIRYQTTDDLLEALTQQLDPLPPEDKRHFLLAWISSSGKKQSSRTTWVWITAAMIIIALVILAQWLQSNG